MWNVEKFHTHKINIYLYIDFMFIWIIFVAENIHGLKLKIDDNWQDGKTKYLD
jgi:hypothetical protein